MLWRWLAAGLSLFICSGGARADALAEAERLKFGVTPIYADEVLPLLDKIAAAPPDVLDYMRKLQAGPTK